MKKYRLISKKGEGTFSEVLKAQSLKDGQYYAIKCMKTHFKDIDQVNSLREIQALRRLTPHANCIKLIEVLYDQPTGRLALVFELMDMNLYELIRGRRNHLDAQLIKVYLWQTLRAIDHMHSKGIFHRDIKPENILIENNYDVYTGLKLADFGSCRGIYSKQPYTEYISTRWYRAPECLLTDGYYGPEMDVWGLGCVFFEVSCLFPLFPGNDEVDQLNRIHKVLGTPDAQTLSFFRQHKSAHMDFNFEQHTGSGIDRWTAHMPPAAVDLLKKMVIYDPRQRISASDALKHPFFDDLRAIPPPEEVVSVKTPQFSPKHISTSQPSTEKQAEKPSAPVRARGGSPGDHAPVAPVETSRSQGDKSTKIHTDTSRSKKSKHKHKHRHKHRQLKQDMLSHQSSYVAPAPPSGATQSSLPSISRTTHNSTLSYQSGYSTHRMSQAPSQHHLAPQLSNAALPSLGAMRASGQAQEARKKPKKYAHVQSSGYGYGVKKSKHSANSYSSYNENAHRYGLPNVNYAGISGSRLFK